MAPSTEEKIDESSTLKFVVDLSPTNTEISQTPPSKQSLESGIDNKNEQTIGHIKETESEEKIVTIENSNNKALNSNLDRSKTKLGSPLKRKSKNLRTRMVLRKFTSKNGFKRTSQTNSRKFSNHTLSLLTKKTVHNQKTDVDPPAHESSSSCAVDTQITDCIACKEQFLDRLELHKHTTTAHPDVPIIFCDLCGNSFLNDNELQNHKITSHKKSTTSSCERPNLAIKSKKRKERSRLKYYSRKYSRGANKTSGKSGIIKPRLIKRPLARNSKLTNVSHDSSVKSTNEIAMDKIEIIPTSTKEIANKEIQLRGSPTEPKQESLVIIKSEYICSDETINDFTDLSNVEMEKYQPLDSCENLQPVDDDNIKNSAHDRTLESQDITFLTVDSFNNEQELIIGGEKNLQNISLNPTASKSYRTYLAKSQSNSSEESESASELEFCFMCKQIFSIIEQKRIKTKAAKSSVQCPLCCLEFSLKFLLKKHIAHDHLNCDCIGLAEPPEAVLKPISPILSEPFTNKSLNHRIYECCHCSSISASHDDLSYHILTYHEIIPSREEQYDKPEYLRNIKNNILQSRSSNVPSCIAENNLSSIHCSNCSLRFATRANYLRHIKDYHKNLISTNKNSWPTWKTENSSASIIVETQQEIGIDECENNSFFKNIETITNGNEEIVRKSEPRKTCKKCSQEFDTVRELSEHFYFAHDDSLENSSAVTAIEKRNHDWRCLHCSQRFKLLQSYIRHRYFVHNDESMVHICENCCKILTSVTLVNIHVCLNVSYWECKACDKTFSNGMALRLHNNDKHMETPGPHICNICEKRFLTKFMLSKHEELGNCHFTVTTPEPFNSIINISHERKRNLSELNYGTTVALKKPKKEYLNIEDMSNIRVLQEDVIVREVTGNIDPQVQEENNLSIELTKSTNEDEIYQCSLCRLYFMSKIGLKAHLNRAHTSAVEICQLCYKMFSTGALVRHMLDHHLSRDSNKQTQLISVKQEDPLATEEHDLEKDTEELIEIIGKDQLYGLCEYHRITEQTNLLDDSCCPDCPLKFDSCAKYRRHHVQMHDKLCALCHEKFESGQEAAKHKTVVHGSIACYVWFAYKVVAAIEDTRTFAEMAKKMVVENLAETNCSSDDDEQDFIDNQIHPLLENDEDNFEINVAEIQKVKLNDSHYHIDDVRECKKNIDENYELAGSTEGYNQDEPQVLLIVTEEDLEKYKNNIPELVRQISFDCNMVITEDIIKMLEGYVRDKL